MVTQFYVGCVSKLSEIHRQPLLDEGGLEQDCPCFLLTFLTDNSVSGSGFQCRLRVFSDRQQKLEEEWVQDAE